MKCHKCRRYSLALYLSEYDRIKNRPWRKICLQCIIEETPLEELKHLKIPASTDKSHKVECQVREHRKPFKLNGDMANEELDAAIAYEESGGFDPDWD